MKACNFILTNLSLKMMQKTFCQFQRYSARKWWKKSALYHLRKWKLFSVAQVKNRKLEGYYTQTTVCFNRDSNICREKLWVRLHLDKMWTNNKFFAQLLFTAAMSRVRFKLVYWFTRLGNTETRQKHKWATRDKLKAIHSIFDQFYEACMKTIHPAVI